MLADLRPWLSGATEYLDHTPGDAGSARIVVVIRVGLLSTHAIVDTAAPWCVVGPEVALAAGLDFDDAPDPEACLWMRVRGTLWWGTLARGTLTVLADEGDDLEIEGTFFVPLGSPDGAAWTAPCFLGLSGALERMRFAVDPARNLFGFGPVV